MVAQTSKFQIENLKKKHYGTDDLYIHKEYGVFRVNLDFVILYCICGHGNEQEWEHINTYDAVNIYIRSGKDAI